ncbi:MAG TPA: hypothetical protein VF503_27060, partial [Sphingobium sp.]|uniref:hypothetical protein n=1 Tax=Sphingobium sp. TaxID=1912891 RepID=UPI002ED0DAA4
DHIVKHAASFSPIIIGRRVYDYAGEEVLSETQFAVGDRLYVREAYYQFGSWHAVEGALTKGGQQKWAFDGAKAMISFDPPADFLVSRSKAFPGLPRWYKRLGRFMPRAASRLTLTVTDVRVERLNDCSEADALAEGIERYDWQGHTTYGIGPFTGSLSPVPAYEFLWDSINGPGSWDANPWVVAVSFDVRKGNIDAE